MIDYSTYKIINDIKLLIILFFNDPRDITSKNDFYAFY